MYARNTVTKSRWRRHRCSALHTATAMLAATNNDTRPSANWDKGI